MQTPKLEDLTGKLQVFVVSLLRGHVATLQASREIGKVLSGTLRTLLKSSLVQTQTGDTPPGSTESISSVSFPRGNSSRRLAETTDFSVPRRSTVVTAWPEAHVHPSIVDLRNIYDWLLIPEFEDNDTDEVLRWEMRRKTKEFDMDLERDVFVDTSENEETESIKAGRSQVSRCLQYSEAENKRDASSTEYKAAEDKMSRMSAALQKARTNMAEAAKNRQRAATELKTAKKLQAHFESACPPGEELADYVWRAVEDAKAQTNLNETALKTAEEELRRLTLTVTNYEEELRDMKSQIIDLRVAYQRADSQYRHLCRKSKVLGLLETVDRKSRQLALRQEECHSTDATVEDEVEIEKVRCVLTESKILALKSAYQLTSEALEAEKAMPMPKEVTNAVNDLEESYLRLLARERQVVNKLSEELAQHTALIHADRYSSERSSIQVAHGGSTPRSRTVTGTELSREKCSLSQDMTQPTGTMQPNTMRQVTDEGVAEQPSRPAAAVEPPAPPRRPARPPQPDPDKLIDQGSSSSESNVKLSSQHMQEGLKESASHTEPPRRPKQPPQPAPPESPQPGVKLNPSKRSKSVQEKTTTDDDKNDDEKAPKGQANPVENAATVAETAATVPKKKATQPPVRQSQVGIKPRKSAAVESGTLTAKKNSK